MDDLELIRSWKDPDHRTELPGPSGQIDLPTDLSGGLQPLTRPDGSCYSYYGCPTMQLYC